MFADERIMRLKVFITFLFETNKRNVIRKLLLKAVFSINKYAHNYCKER